MKRLFTNAAMLACLLALVGGCSGADSAFRPAIPSIRAQQGIAQFGCYLWSCADGDCQFDPAIYGACCLQMADSTHEEFPKPSCGDPNPNDPNNDCGTSSNFGGPYTCDPIFGCGYCNIEYACCYNSAGF